MPDAEPATAIWIVEDEPAAARLAADLCVEHGAKPLVFSAPLSYLSALRDGGPPAVVVLDWRLEHELSAALYLATRHRYPLLPVIYWTGSVPDALPTMIRADEMTVVVDKADGSVPFDRAVSWALAAARSG
jgi:DNA-binding NtrC family response regulator